MTAKVCYLVFPPWEMKCSWQEKKLFWYSLVAGNSHLQAWFIRNCEIQTPILPEQHKIKPTLWSIFTFLKNLNLKAEITVVFVHVSQIVSRKQQLHRELIVLYLKRPMDRYCGWTKTVGRCRALDVLLCIATSQETRLRIFYKAFHHSWCL